MPKPREDDAFEQAITEAGQAESATSLDEVVDFDWDEVAIFAEGTPKAAIEKVVGETGMNLIMWPTYTIVFRNDGEIVKIILGTPMYAISGDFERLLGADTMLVPDPNYPGYVRFTDDA
jgi:hypothetical protein